MNILLTLDTSHTSKEPLLAQNILLSTSLLNFSNKLFLANLLLILSVPNDRDGDGYFAGTGEGDVGLDGRVVGDGLEGFGL